MYNPSASNFVGRDQMQWWIGQVTDPKKGEWEKSREKQTGKDGKEVYSHRCRVRIVGYHGNDADLPDKDLPMAHVLMPPGESSTGGRGRTMNYQGGEVVVGFFLDGADAQQPVVFGTLFRQTFVKDKLKSDKFNAFKQTEFTPYTPPDVKAKVGKDKAVEKSPYDWGFKTFAQLVGGKVINASSAATKEINVDTNIKLDNITACEDNEISNITNALKNFTKEMNSYQDVGGLTLDPMYGGVVDKKQEIKLASMKIHASMSRLIRRGRSWTIQETMNKLSKTMKDKTPSSFQPGVAQAAKGLNDIIFCNFEKIIEQLGDYLNKSLENMLGSILDVPTCAVESFLGDMFGQLNNILDTNLGSTFDQLNNIQGGGISPPSEIFSKAIKFANILTNTLECDAQNCPPNTQFSSKSGTSKSGEDNFSNILGIANLNSITNPLGAVRGLAGGAVSDALGGGVLGGVASGLIGGGGISGVAGNLLPDFDIGLDGLIPDISPSGISKPDCNTNVLRCGPPKVDFIGSPDGKGASGSAIVNALGKIIGVAINEPGSGYIKPPSLTFVDGCDNGFGAGGYVRMNEDGAVEDVVITDGGQGFLPNTTDTTRDENGNLVVKEVTPDPNANYDGAVSYVSTLSDVVVENTGFGYEPTDTVTVSGGSVSPDGINIDEAPGKAEVELEVVDGRVVGANVVNSGFGFTDIPEITINSDTGVLARITPILKFTKIDDASQLADTNIPFDRELTKLPEEIAKLPSEIPQDAVITVIDCVTK
tara:strand:+ start:251 stop:2539 length:2289 start_codon:yes stop_codon:yes gene_type:complete